jgi:hypothetical protein
MHLHGFPISQPATGSPLAPRARIRQVFLCAESTVSGNDQMPVAACAIARFRDSTDPSTQRNSHQTFGSWLSRAPFDLGWRAASQWREDHFLVTLHDHPVARDAGRDHRSTITRRARTITRRDTAIRPKENGSSYPIRKRPKSHQRSVKFTRSDLIDSSRGPRHLGTKCRSIPTFHNPQTRQSV